MTDNRLGTEIEWIDTARAMSIFLVVMMHASLYFPIMNWPQRDQAIEIWGLLSEIAQPVRMPLFFLVSAMLASTAVFDDTARTRRKRIWRPLYLYGLWAGLLMVIMPFDKTVGPLPRSSEGYALWLVGGGTPAWYFYGLAIFFVLTRAIAHWPKLWVLGFRLLLSVLGRLTRIASPAIRSSSPVAQYSS